MLNWTRFITSKDNIDFKCTVAIKLRATSWPVRLACTSSSNRGQHVNFTFCAWAWKAERESDEDEGEDRNEISNRNTLYPFKGVMGFLKMLMTDLRGHFYP